MTCRSITVFRGTLTIRALVMGDGALCYGALEIVGLLLLLLLLLLLSYKTQWLPTVRLMCAFCDCFLWPDDLNLDFLIAK